MDDSLPPRDGAFVLDFFNKAASPPDKYVTFTGLSWYSSKLLEPSRRGVTGIM